MPKAETESTFVCLCLYFIHVCICSCPHIYYTHSQYSLASLLAMIANNYGYVYLYVYLFAPCFHNSNDIEYRYCFVLQNAVAIRSCGGVCDIYGVAGDRCR
eukprot:g5159.t1